MHRETLRENLRKLRTELASAAENLDENLHTLLRGVADDIERVLGGKAAEAHAARERLEKIAVKFEANHPRLAKILGEMADTLGKLGI